MKATIRYLRNLSFERLLLAIWVFCLPLILNKYVRLVSLFERLQVSDAVFFLLFIVFLFRSIRHKIKLNLTCLWFPLVLLIASNLVSAFRSGNPPVSFSELCVIIYLIVAYLTVANIVRDKESLYFVLKAWVLISSLVALLGILGMAFAFLGFDNTFVKLYPLFLNKQYRFISTLPLPNLAYTYLHLSFFLALGLFINERHRPKRLFYLLAVLILLLAIFFTFSRGWVSFLLSLGLFLYFFSGQRKSKPRFIAGILFLIALIIFIFIQLFITYATDLDFSFRSGYDQKYKVDYSDTIRNRLYKEDFFFEAGHPYSRLDMSVVFLPGDYWYKKKAAIQLWQILPHRPRSRFRGMQPLRKILQLTLQERLPLPVQPRHYI